MHSSSPPSLVKPVITVDIRGGLAVVDPPVAALEAELEYSRATFDAGGPVGYRRAVETKALFTRDFRGRLVVPTGLVPRIVERLECLGYRVTVNDLREFDTSKLAVDSAFVARTFPEDREFIAAVTNNPIGQIQVGGIREMDFCLFLMCRVFCAARIAVAAATKQQARRLRNILAKATAERVGLCGGIFPLTTLPRITVGTYTELAALRYIAAQILILADGVQATGEVAKRAVGSTTFDAMHVYSFVRVGQRLDAASSLCLEAMSGRIIFSVEPDLAAVHVAAVRPPTSVDTSGLESLQRKRAAFWANEGRNNFVARVATAATACDTRRLRELGVCLDDAELPAAAVQGWRVAVVVESPEHGRALQRLLPDWQMKTRMPAIKDVVSDGGGHIGSIVTLAYAARHGIDADVVVRCDGGGAFQIPGFPPERGDAAECRLLVDVTDDFDDRARRDARQRSADYVRRGWLNPGSLSRGTPGASRRPAPPDEEATAAHSLAVAADGSTAGTRKAREAARLGDSHGAGLHARPATTDERVTNPREPEHGTATSTPTRPTAAPQQDQSTPATTTATADPQGSNAAACQRPAATYEGAQNLTTQATRTQHTHAIRTQTSCDRHPNSRNNPDARTTPPPQHPGDPPPQRRPPPPPPRETPQHLPQPSEAPRTPQPGCAPHPPRPYHAPAHGPTRFTHCPATHHRPGPTPCRDQRP